MGKISGWGLGVTSDNSANDHRENWGSGDGLPVNGGGAAMAIALFLGVYLKTFPKAKGFYFRKYGHRGHGG